MKHRYYRTYGAYNYNRIPCSMCKMKMYYHAKRCPHCGVSLTARFYRRLTRWQLNARRILVVISALAGLVVAQLNGPVIISIIAGLAVYGAGLKCIIRMQGFKNFIY